MASWSDWKAVAAKHRAAVPKGSPFSAYQAAMRRASAEYRGRAKPSETNPSVDLGRWAKIGLVAAAAYLLLKRTGEQPTGAPQPTQPNGEQWWLPPEEQRAGRGVKPDQR